MFSKKIKCGRCGKSIDKKYDFCPHCGNQLKETKKREEQFENIEKQLESALNMPFFVKFPFRQLVKQLEKQFDAEMRQFDKELESKKTQEKKPLKDIPLVSGISISISGGNGEEPKIFVKNLGQGQGNQIKGYSQTPEERIEESAEKLTKQNLEKTRAMPKKFSKLPKTEPETKVRRLTDRVIYEIAVPGVKNIKDVIINKLENSIEIKAFSKDKAYFKLIPISLPIKKYKLEEEKIIIELVP